VAGWGAFAEYVSVPENAIALKPANLTFEQAAAVPESAVVALQALRDRGKIQPGQKVLINGASGGVGTYAVQIAKSFGAEVTAVDSAGKMDMLRSIGADHVIDYAQKDFTKNGETYDVIIDVVGKKLFSRRLKSLKRKGYYFLANAGLSHVVLGLWTSMVSKKKVIFGSASQKKEDLLFLKELVEAGKIKSVVDRCYSLEQIPEAHRYVETGQKQGNVVITVGTS
jgi:NADPH:quinone reductase-like Zn-dependent oxidoreductase